MPPMTSNRPGAEAIWIVRPLPKNDLHLFDIFIRLRLASFFYYKTHVTQPILSRHRKNRSREALRFPRLCLFRIAKRLEFRKISPPSLERLDYYKCPFK